MFNSMMLIREIPIVLFLLRIVTITVAYVNLADVVVRRGENATFQCSYSSTTANITRTRLYHQWVNKTEVAIVTLETAATDGLEYFIISEVDLDDAGKYICSVDLSNGLNESNTATLIITYLDTPELTVPSAVLQRGRTAHFTCTKPNGYPPPDTYRWLKDGLLLNTSVENRYRATNRSLIIDQVTLIDSGLYQCLVENQYFKEDFGSNSEMVEIKVLDVEASHAIAKEDDVSSILSCSIAPIRVNITHIAWARLTTAALEYSNILSKSDHYDIEQSVGRTTLTIRKVNRNDNGTYRCTISVDGLTLTAHAHMKVNYIDRPGVSGDPIKITHGLKRGQSIDLACTVPDAEPPVDIIKWFQDGQNIIASEIKTQRDFIRGGQILRLVTFSEADVGAYTCRAESEIFRGNRGKMSYNAADLNLIYLNQPHMTVSANEIGSGSTVVFTCFLPAGYPSPSEVIWLKDNIPMKSQHISKEDINKGELHLEIVSVGSDDAGSYNCRIQSDAYGNADGQLSNATKVVFLVDKEKVENDQFNVGAVIIAVVVLIVVAVVILSVYILCFKDITLLVREQQVNDTATSIIVECNYRPWLARASTVQWVTPNGPLPVMTFPSCINTLKGFKHFKEIIEKKDSSSIGLRTVNPDRYTVASDGKCSLYLQITGVRPGDSGEYTCIVQRRNEKKQSTDNGTIRIHSTLVVGPGETYTDIDSVTMSCICIPVTEPIDSFIWFLADETGEVLQGHGRALASSSDISSRGRYRCSWQGNTSYLTIRDPTEDDARNYQCKVIRKYDNIPFQTVVVLFKDQSSLEWKTSKFQREPIQVYEEQIDVISDDNEWDDQEDEIVISNDELGSINQSQWKVAAHDTDDVYENTQFNQQCNEGNNVENVSQNGSMLQTHPDINGYANWKFDMENGVENTNNDVVGTETDSKSTTDIYYEPVNSFECNAGDVSETHTIKIRNNVIDNQVKVDTIDIDIEDVVRSVDNNGCEVTELNELKHGDIVPWLEELDNDVMVS